MSIFMVFNTFLYGATGFCASSEVDYKITTDFLTKYIWRGQNVSDRPVFQPTVSMYGYGFTGSFWGNMDLTGQNGHRMKFIELNYVLDYTTSIPDMNGLTFSAGFIHYDFPNTEFESTTEVYGGFNFALPLSPYIRLYRDVDETEGTYIQFGAGHSIEKVFTISEDCYCGLQVSGNIGYADKRYNDFFFRKDNGGFNDLRLSLALPVCFKQWIISPSISYSMMLDKDIRSATDKSDNLWAGLGLSKSF